MEHLFEFKRRNLVDIQFEFVSRRIGQGDMISLFLVIQEFVPRPVTGLPIIKEHAPVLRQHICKCKNYM